MYKLELFQNGNDLSKEFESLDNFNSFVDKLFKSNIVLDYSKAWLYKDNQLHAVIDCIKQDVRFAEDFSFTNIERFKNYKNLPLIYHIFAVQAWGDLLYLNYTDLNIGEKQDLDNFIKTFSKEEIEKLSETLLEDIDGYGGTHEDYDDNVEWIGEGMKMFIEDINGNKIFHQYLTRIVIDNLLGIRYKYLTEPMVIYRTWGLYSGKTKADSDNYMSWVSTSKSNIHYETTDEYSYFERFVLPVGFPIVDTCINGINYADEDEIIVRNIDLLQV